MRLLKVIIVLVVLLRFVNLTIVPVFFDEAYYLSHAVAITENFHTLFASLEGSVFPIMVWLLSVIYLLTKSWASNFLVVGRIFSIACDVGAAFFVFQIGNIIWDKKYGLLAMLIYLSFPLTFFHSRLVLLEPLANLFSIIVVYLVVRLAWKQPVINKKLGSVLGIITFSLLSLFTKPIGILSLVSAAAVSLFAPKRLLFPILVSAFIIFVIFTPCVKFVSSYINNGWEIQNLFFNLKINLHRSAIWIQDYVTLPLFLLMIISSLTCLFTKKWKFYWLIVWFLVVVIGDSLLIRFYYPRHLYLVVGALSLLAAFALRSLLQANKLLYLSILIIVLFACWQKNYYFLTNPTKVLAREDRQQFYEDWTSGSGFDKTVSLLKTLPSGDIYVEDSSTAWTLSKIYGLKSISIKIINLNLTSGSYLVLNHNLNVPNGLKVVPVASIARSSGREIRVFKIL